MMVVKIKKAKNTKKCFIKRKLKFENYKKCFKFKATQFDKKINYLQKNKIYVDRIKKPIKNS